MNTFNSKEAARINTEVCLTHDYDNHVIAKFDDAGNRLAVFANRNNAVRHHFQSQGLSNKQIVLKYLAFNGALKNCMTAGKRWYKHYYMYIPKHTVPASEVVHNATTTFKSIPIITVDKSGAEHWYKSITDYAMKYNISLATAIYYIDSGKCAPTREYLYKVGKTVEFGSKRLAMKHYRIGKDKFKRLLQAKAPMRGQTIRIS